MARRTVIEMLHVAGGLLVTLVIARLSIWAYPLGRFEVATVAWVAAAAVVAMGVAPVRRALAIDRGRASHD